MHNSRVKQKIEIAANFAVVAVAVVVCVVLLREHLGKAQPSTGLLRPGQQFQLRGVSWNAHKQTLVLALRPGCEFCERSAPFYRSLVRLEGQGAARFRIVAALPGDPAEGRAFLAGEGLSSVESAFVDSLASVGISGTPTLVLVNNHGRVTRVWVGLLSSGEEKSVERAVGLKSPVSLP